VSASSPAGRRARTRPPRLARALIARLVWSEDRAFLLADLDEELEQMAAERGPRAARRWYRAQTLRSVLPLARRRLSAPGRRPRAAARDAAPHRSEDSMSWLQRFSQDVRHAARAVRRSPRYAAAVIVTFALASGANIAVFSVVNSVLLRPLPYAAPDELVMVHRVTDYGIESGVSLPDFRDWRAASTSFARWAGYSGSGRTYLGPDGAERWRGVEATGELFEVLGVPPLAGRALQSGSDHVGDPVIVLGHGLWTRRFGADPDIVGRSIRFEDGTATVIGVMPAGFYFPTPDEEYWMPIAESPYIDQRGAWLLQTIGRLAPGVTLEAAQTEVGAVARRVAEAADGTAESPCRTTCTEVSVESRHEAYVGDTRRLFAILLGAVGLVLAIACANIANLGLTHATGRSRELAVRAALGAGRGRLSRQLIAEHVLLALGGALVGLLLSFAVLRGLVALGPDDLPRLGEVGIDWTALGYAMLVALVCGVVFGAVPALSASRASIGPALKDADRGSVGRTGRRTLRLLITTQVSLAVLLVLGAGLLVQSFLHLSEVRPGFDTRHVLAVHIDLPESRYGTPEATEGFYGSARGRLVGRSGIEAVGFTTHLPFSGSRIQASYTTESATGERTPGSDLELEVVGEGYFESVGIPRLAGRDISREDGPDAPLVAVVNQRFAELRWPGRNPIGRRFALDDSADADTPWHEIVGVVGTTLKRGMDDEPRPVAYFPRRQFQPTYGLMSGRSGYLTLRTTGAPARVISTVRSELAAIDPALPLPRIETSAELVSRSMAEPRFRTILLGSFAGLALLVALLGVYGVMAFAVARRTREIGIRMALGASARRIRGGVLRSGASLLVAGLAIGLGGGLAATRLLRSMLFGVSPSDPGTYAAAGALVVLAGVAACWLPARRASRVEPITALREE